MPNRDELLVLAAQIVSAHVANNTVVPGDVPRLINDVYSALAGAGRAPNAAAAAEPAVPVKRSVTPDHLICLECGKHFSTLKRHLGTDHQLTPDQYRQKWDLRHHTQLWRQTTPRRALFWRRKLAWDAPQGRSRCQENLARRSIGSRSCSS
jgi:predicted transcriptional regulator